MCGCNGNTGGDWVPGAGGSGGDRLGLEGAGRGGGVQVPKPMRGTWVWKGDTSELGCMGNSSVVGAQRWWGLVQGSLEGLGGE